MDDSSCLRFFLEPDDTLHRRYEALRAYFVQRRPLQEIAAQFGYTYDTLRQVDPPVPDPVPLGRGPPFFAAPRPGRPPRAPDPSPSPRRPRWPTEGAWT